MPDFAYQAVDVAGRRVRGREEAPSPLALTRGLEARGLVVIAVGEAPATAVRVGDTQLARLRTTQRCPQCRAELHYAGDPARLQLALAQRDLALSGGGTAWTLQRRGAAAPQ